MANNKIVLVKNRSASMVVYKLPEKGIRREFQPGETKKIPLSELEELTYQSGGRTLIANFLQITEEKVTDELNIHTENEYYMSEEQIKDLILYGSLDAFLDCLDYAPIGVIDLLKNYAISLPMNDIQKREALKNKTGFDVTVILENLRQEAQVDNVEKAESAPAPTTSTRRRASTNYKVVSKTEDAKTEETKAE